MVKFEECVNAIINNPESDLIESYKLESGEGIEIDKNQSCAFKIKGDSYETPRHAVVYKYRFYDRCETRFIIACAYNGFVVSINAKDSDTGAIEIRSSIYDRPNGNTIVGFTFCDDKFVIIKTKEKRDEIKKTGLIKSGVESINVRDWTPEMVLDEMLHAVKIAYDDAIDHEKWEKESEMIFNLLKPALRMVVMNLKNMWEEYNRDWEEYYANKAKEYGDKIKKLVEERDKSFDQSTHFKETKEILEGIASDEYTKGRRK